MPQVRKSMVPAADDDAGMTPSAAALRLVGSPPPEAASLTRRELEGLGWCADGKSYWETAVILGIAERTVSFHMEAVRTKLDADSNAHAVAMALRAGLLEIAIG